MLLGVLIAACQDNTPKFSYKGSPRLSQPAITVFPNNQQYHVDKKVPATMATELDGVIQAMMDQQEITGLTVTVLIPDLGIWSLDTGYLDFVEKRKVNHSTIFYWASVGKLVTSIMIQHLIDDKQLSLDDTLAGWFPDFQWADKITIYDLLHHTSGIYSFNSDSSVQNNPKYRTPQELLQIARENKNLFHPGEYWAYSNTNYLLLALIAEKITGRNFAQLVEELVARPYQLKTLRVLQPKEIPENLALGHINGEVTTKDYSIPLGAGNIVGSSQDMVLLMQKLMTGEIFPLDTIHSWLKHLYPMFDRGLYYGQGIMGYDFSKINQTDQFWIGHSGGTPDYNAIVVYDVDSRIILALSINNAISATAAAFQLLKTIKSD